MGQSGSLINSTTSSAERSFIKDWLNFAAACALSLRCEPSEKKGKKEKKKKRKCARQRETRVPRDNFPLDSHTFAHGVNSVLTHERDSSQIFLLVTEGGKILRISDEIRSVSREKSLRGNLMYDDKQIFIMLYCVNIILYIQDTGMFFQS